MSGLAVCQVHALQGPQDTLAVFSGSISTYILREIGWPDARINDIKKKKILDLENIIPHLILAYEALLRYSNI